MKMKLFAAAAVVSAMTASANAGVLLSHTFDISGLASNGSFGANFPTMTFDFGVPGTIVSVTANVNFTTNSPSWMTEPQIAIDTTDDASLDGDFNAEDYGALEEVGTFAYTDTLTTDSDSSDGLVFLTLWESFEDTSASPDAVYGANSTVTVNYTPIPAPSSAALLGLTALVARRRRR